MKRRSASSIAYVWTSRSQRFVPLLLLITVAFVAIEYIHVYCMVHLPGLKFCNETAYAIAFAEMVHELLPLSTLFSVQNSRSPDFEGSVKLV